MELDKLKYVWARPIALLFLFIVFCMGLFLLYVSFFSNFDPINGLFPMLHVAGFIFTGFGSSAGIVHYRNGITYVQKGKVPFNELDRFAVELNVAVAAASIGAVSDQNSVTINSRIYPSLYCWLFRRKS